jgi:hypothetical protein
MKWLTYDGLKVDRCRWKKWALRASGRHVVIYVKPRLADWGCLHAILQPRRSTASRYKRNLTSHHNVPQVKSQKSELSPSLWLLHFHSVFKIEAQYSVCDLSKSQLMSADVMETTRGKSEDKPSSPSHERASSTDKQKSIYE